MDVAMYTVCGMNMLRWDELKLELELELELELDPRSGMSTRSSIDSMSRSDSLSESERGSKFHLNFFTLINTII